MAAAIEIIGTLLFLSLLFSTIFVEGQSEYDVRLVGGTSKSNGRVEIFYNQVWNTICDFWWGYFNSEVVCTQLGYGILNASPRLGGYYPGGTGSNLRVSCSYNATHIQQCDFISYSCSADETAGVDCGPEDMTTTLLYPNGAVRLAAGPTNDEGRVEVYYYGRWGVVCDNGWDDRDAKVVCRQLGYPSSSKAEARTNDYYGRGLGGIFLDYVYCEGDEPSLASCNSAVWSSYDCNGGTAGVHCEPSTAPLTIGMLSFVGVSLFIIIVIGAVAVHLTCRKSKTSASPLPSSMRRSSVNGSS